jgi:hypothetical protein
MVGLSDIFELFLEIYHIIYQNKADEKCRSMVFISTTYHQEQRRYSTMVLMMLTFP